MTDSVGGHAQMTALRRRVIRCLVVLLVVAGGSAIIWSEPVPVRLMHEVIWDRYVEIQPRRWDAEIGVRVVDIDEKSLARYGQWPWPRTRIARLVDALRGYGVRVVAFDVIFAEPDRSSLGEVFEALKQDLPGYVPPLTPEALAAAPANDVLLAAAIAKLPVVLGLSIDKSTDRQGRRRIYNLPGIVFADSEAANEDWRYMPSFDGAIASLPELQKAAASNAGLDMVVDPDGITRRVPLLIRIGSRNVPALSLAAVLAADGGRAVEAESRHPGFLALRVGTRRVPTDRYARMRLYDSGTEPGRYVSAADVLDGTATKEQLRGAIVVVGTGAETLTDLRLTPLDRWVPGIEVHAQAIEQILTGAFLARPEWGRDVEAAATALVGLLLLAATWWTSTRFPPWLIALAFGVGLLGAGWLVFARNALLFDPVLPAATLLAAAILERFMLVLDLRRERAVVRNAFSRYLSPALVEQLAADPDKLVLGGLTRQMTFLFSDVRGFTSISEGYKQDPQGLTRLINRFLTPMTGVILARQGTIDKYMGDCVMAFWNAPLDDPAHASHACEAALAMMQELALLNERLAAEARGEGREAQALVIGIGINSGSCVVGNIGSEQRFDYSVLGDAVNLASRLEGQSKTYGVSIVVGEDTLKAAPDFAALELDLIAVKGKDEAVRVFALLGDAAVKAAPEFERLAALQAEMLAVYRAQDWERASALVAEVRGRDERLATLCALYDERIVFYRANPPGPGWDGVYAAESK